MIISITYVRQWKQWNETYFLRHFAPLATDVVVWICLLTCWHLIHKSVIVEKFITQYSKRMNTFNFELKCNGYFFVWWWTYEIWQPCLSCNHWHVCIIILNMIYSWPVSLAYLFHKHLRLLFIFYVFILDFLNVDTPGKLKRLTIVAF